MLASIFSICTLAAGAIPPAEHLQPRADTQTFDIHYEVQAESFPLLGVELWYTTDQGESWQRHGPDPDMVSPMAFAAKEDGLHGFYFIITNAGGASGPMPSRDTAPQFWVFVDYTPPICQMHPPAVEAFAPGRTMARLHWTSIDAHLAERPIDLDYRVLPHGAWTQVARDLPNSGRYDWHVPPTLSGEVMIRVTARDRGGHQSQAVTAAVSLSGAVPQRTMAPMQPAATRPIEPPPRRSTFKPIPPPAAAMRTTAPQAVAARPAVSDRVPSDRVPTPRESIRAAELLLKARHHRLRSEHELASGRLREALRLDPELTEALVELGWSQYALLRYDEAAAAFESALRQMPNDRDALFGLSQTLLAMRKYEASETKLLTLVKRYPRDVEGWLHLGDVAIYRGDELAAREYFVKAATMQPHETVVVAQAKARLQDLPLLQRRYEAMALP